MWVLHLKHQPFCKTLCFLCFSQTFALFLFSTMIVMSEKPLQPVPPQVSDTTFCPSSKRYSTLCFTGFSL